MQVVKYRFFQNRTEKRRMTNLVAYIPTLNQRHLDWFKKYHGANLFLIRQEMAESLLPRLSRNMAAVSTDMMATIIRSIGPFENVGYFDSDLPDMAIMCREFEPWIFPDEDISHLVFEKYFDGEHGAKFEMIWARWDMTAVTAQQPVIPDCEITMEEMDIFRTTEARKIAQRSPDWWRQIGILFFRDGNLIASGVNEHFPTEYETDAFGDPRQNFDAGDPVGMDAYVSLHAEEYGIAFCSDQGISLRGSSAYIDTFPCGRCARALSLTGITELFFRNGYSSLKGFETLKSRGIKIIQVKDPASA
jgi:deoxycytidylate deaminase